MKAVNDDVVEALRDALVTCLDALCNETQGEPESLWILAVKVQCQEALAKAEEVSA